MSRVSSEGEPENQGRSQEGRPTGLHVFPVRQGAELVSSALLGFATSRRPCAEPRRAEAKHVKDTFIVSGNISNVTTALRATREAKHTVHLLEHGTVARQTIRNQAQTSYQGEARTLAEEGPSLRIAKVVSGSAVHTVQDSCKETIGSLCWK